MRVRLIAVGTRPPGWVRDACEDYITRLGSRLPLSITEIAAGPRSAGEPPARAIGLRALRCCQAFSTGSIAGEGSRSPIAAMHSINASFR